MSNRSFTRTVPRQLPLAVCLGAVLGFTLSTASATPMRQLRHRPQHDAAIPPIAMPLMHIGSVLKPGGNLPSNPASPLHHVTSCNDDPNDPGSLRSIVAAATTVSGDHIDFAQLMCSTITLDATNGALTVMQSTLYLDGPGAANLTIDANGGSQALYHFGGGTLYISDLTIANGHYTSSTLPNGGCICSEGNVQLFQSVVTHCDVTSSDVGKPALGGGVYTRGTLTLVRSTISDAHAFSMSGGISAGGGACVGGDFFSHDSTIDKSSAEPVSGATAFGGGVYVVGSIADIEGTTVSANRAAYYGGLALIVGTGSIISNSTVSGNFASIAYGGAWTDRPLTLENSTIAFNHSELGPDKGSGLFIRDTTLTLQSSIIAGNSGVSGTPDLGGLNAQVSGGRNLVASSGLVLPIGTGNIEGVCPKLDPLLDNGGYTHTHGLNHASPAIDAGDAGNTTLDQRGAPRPTGIAADIGALERQPTDVDERILASNFDGFCDF